MKAYIGTKVVLAEPMTENTFRESTGAPTVETSRPGYKVAYSDGYTSWSPKEVFERCYREITLDEKSLASLDPEKKEEANCEGV